MNDLLVITEKELGARREQCVNGRDLHAFLEVQNHFTDWIKGRIEDYRFQEGVDYEVFRDSPKNPNGGRPYLEYSISLDMAKELCMIERSEKGREARKYFIQCEKGLKRIRDAQADIQTGQFSHGLRTGISLTRVLDRTGFDLADAARLVWYRNAELTQAEAAKLFGVTRDRVQDVERVLRDAGIEFPTIKANKRTRQMRQLLDDMLGFKDRDLRLVPKPATAQTCAVERG